MNILKFKRKCEVVLIFNFFAKNIYLIKGKMIARLLLVSIQKKATQQKTALCF
jgi:hypothetical protein